MRRLAALLAVLALTACGGGSDSPEEAPPTPKIAGVEVFPGLSHDHVQGDVTYEQMPPVGGKHAPVWLKCAVYDEPVPEENAVHSMEHGGIWITHDPGLSGDDLTRLHRLQSLNAEFVLISPLAGLPVKVVASSWGLQLKVDAVDDPRLAEFVQEYAGGDQGGEKGAPCASNGKTPEQLKASPPAM